METVGNHIVEMEQLMRTALNPPPNWIRRWQTEAEHVLHLAHEARDSGDMSCLVMLDGEAKKLVDERKAKTSPE